MKKKCIEIVALKELLFDASYIKVNKIYLLVNYWTSSTDPKWSQKNNTNLCMLNENEIIVTMNSKHLKYVNNIEKKYNQKERNFLIQQHQLSYFNFDNSQIIKESLKKRVKQLQYIKK